MDENPTNPAFLYHNPPAAMKKQEKAMLMDLFLAQYASTGALGGRGGREEDEEESCRRVSYCEITGTDHRYGDGVPAYSHFLPASVPASPMAST